LRVITQGIPSLEYSDAAARIELMHKLDIYGMCYCPILYLCDERMIYDEYVEIYDEYGNLTNQLENNNLTHDDTEYWQSISNQTNETIIIHRW